MILRKCLDGTACKKPGECEARGKCAVFGPPHMPTGEEAESIDWLRDRGYTVEWRGPGVGPTGMEMEVALRRLMKESAAVIALAEPQIREACGHTNFACLQNAVNEAAKVLGVLRPK